MQVQGARLSGEPLDRPTARDGRVVIVLQLPVLEALSANASTLILYGRLGRRYVLESATNLGPQAVWSPLKEVVPTRAAEPITGLRQGLPVVFYRARQVGAVESQVR